MSTSPQTQSLTLLYTLRGHTTPINRIAWSPDGHWLGSPSNSGVVHIWDLQNGKSLYGFDCGDTAYSVALSRDNGFLASGMNAKGMYLWKTEKGTTPVQLFTPSAPGAVHNISFVSENELISSTEDGQIVTWDVSIKRPIKIINASIWNKRAITCFAWQPQNRVFAFARSGNSRDQPINVWDYESGEQLYSLKGHNNVLSIAWSPNGKLLASASVDKTIYIWNPESGKISHMLEGHTGPVVCVTFSFDGKVMASKSLDGTIRLWRCDDWQVIATLDERAANNHGWGSIAFHPSLPLLATLGEGDTVVRIWKMDVEQMFVNGPTIPQVSYANAKVVLVGDTGVGKSGLGLVLTGQKFEPTESTHGRRVWVFDHQSNLDIGEGRKETREALLWDLAGQPGYRLIHQLHLTEVAVALLVFDSRSEIDPFAGVRYWDRALRQSHRLQGASAPPLMKFLVAARMDRGGIGVSQGRISIVLKELDLDGYFETSAKEGWQIKQLIQALRKAIAWESLPRVSSTELFENIKAFLVQEKASGRLLSTADNLYHSFMVSQKIVDVPANLRAQFETCIGRVESRDLIRRLNFSNLILLQPELLDAYASALINSAREEPDGLGCINEETARNGQFRISEDERIKDKAQETLLLIATIEDLLRYEIALREGSDLVFPAQFTRENPTLPNPEGQAVIFTFEGPTQNIYTTLTVRLARSELFRKKQMWKNAAEYIATGSGTCGIYLRELGEGQSELTLFFDKATDERTRYQFEEFVTAHLRRRTLTDTLKRRRIFACSNCNQTITDQQTQARRAKGKTTLNCPVCDTEISLLDREERLEILPSSLVSQMDEAADRQRDLATAQTVLEGKRKTGDFDVFLCHNADDKPAVKRVGEVLKAIGLLPWLDEWELRPGLPWQRVLERQIKHIKAAVVFVGPNGFGPWQNLELEALLREFAKRECPVIPVILPECKTTPELPVFLGNMTWVDFRKAEPNPLERLIWGITGQHSYETESALLQLVTTINMPTLLYEIRAIVRGEISILRQDLMAHADANTHLTLSRLDENQLVIVQDLWNAADVITESEMRQMISLLNELRRDPPPVLVESLNSLPPAVEGPKIDIQHALKVTAPIIPLILSYEGEITLGSGVNLKAALKQLVGKAQRKRL